MDFGVTGKLGGHHSAEPYRKNAVSDRNAGVSFAKLAAAKAEGFIAEQDILNPNPQKGYLIALDENGDIAHACVTSEKMSVSSADFIKARKAGRNEAVWEAMPHVKSSRCDFERLRNRTF